MRVKTSNDFIDFLIDEGALYKYLNNILRHIHTYHIINTITVSGCAPLILWHLEFPFYWAETLEGFDYWCKLDDKYEELYK